jgi:hypothetical protein
MSYPYPQDRHRDRKEKGEQPYKDDREAMARRDSELRAESQEMHELLPQESQDECLARLEAEAAKQLKAVQDERAESAQKVIDRSP